jgi:hypothetical protein
MRLLVREGNPQTGGNIGIGKGRESREFFSRLNLKIFSPKLPNITETLYSLK